MSGKWKLVWSDHDTVHESIFDNAELAINYIDQLHDHERDLRPVVEVTRLAAGAPSLSIAVGGGETVVTFEQSPDPPYYISSGDSSRDGVSLMFFHGGQGIEHLAKNLIPWELGRRVLMQFLTSEERPDQIEWEKL